QVLDAVVRHPVTGQAVWFNQAHAFHISTLDPDVQQGMRELFAEEDLPRNVCYGDRGPIGAAEFDAIRAAIARATVSFRWQRGDVLMLDNMLAAHGREPYRGERRVVVGMSEPWDRRKLTERLSA
ncbi:MAG TPA: TauD/TfdA family dioxygenase, partial [Candidatus Eisenbacteria bacterium]|nr:TauD/TfdA family dioxygenase [Candidatus Eisenbacteria bacterium]